jgi:prophage antirepressor-like protein
MNELKIFENPEFGKVRTVVVDGEPWFVGNDIARALGYKDLYSALRHNVENEDKRLCPVSSTSGTQDTTVVNESGMYSLIFNSKLDSAKNFKKWVTSDVLPSIRKNGGYIQNQEELTPEQLVAKALVVANQIIAEKEAKITEMEPKAEYFDNLVDSRLLTTFRDTAKELHIPPKEFTQWLVNNGYVYRDRHKMLKPYEKHRKNGLFQMKDFSTPFGYSNVQTYITVKGKETFRLLIGGVKNDI